MLPGVPLDEVRRLTGTAGGDIVLTGSVTPHPRRPRGGPRGRAPLFVYPAVQGAGRGLVADGTDLPDLSLLEARSFRSGVTLLRYALT